MKRSWLVPLGGILLLAVTLFMLPATAQAAPRACQDLNDNKVCDLGEPDIPSIIGTDPVSFPPFLNAVLIEKGMTVECKGFPDFGLKIVAPKIIVRGTVQCLFAGGSGITLKSTGSGPGPNGILIEDAEGVVKSGSAALTLDSNTTIVVNGGTIEGLFLGTAVFITSKGDQAYSGAKVIGPNGIFITSGGKITATGGGPDPCDGLDFVVPGDHIKSPADRDVWQNKLTAQQLACLCFTGKAANLFGSTDTGEIHIKASNLIDLSGATIKAGRLVLIESAVDEVKLIGACVENTEGTVNPNNLCKVADFAENQIPGYLANGGEILVNSGPGKTVDFDKATLRDGGNDGPAPHGAPTFNGKETCVADPIARTVGVPFFCE
jgi:hypothetical protein